MKELLDNIKNYTLYSTALLAIALGFVGYQYMDISSDLEVAQEELESAEAEADRLAEDITKLRAQNKSLGEELVAAENKYLGFDDTIKGLAGVVDDLDKLAKTDEELLQKYSKVYFLNEHYTPPSLAHIDEDFIYEAKKDRSMQIHADVHPHLNSLLKEAQKDNIDLRIVSAFRSFNTQADLKSHYTVVYGKGTANQFSADQGYSEHQLGTTIDFTSPEESAPFTAFETTRAYDWLQENAYRFGFVLSYPQENSYYQFEPWHWRFVGTELAGMLHENNLHFYDLSQREIDTYLISLFE